MKNRTKTARLMALAMALLMALAPAMALADSAHTLTYRKRSLVWEDAEGIAPDGTAHLRIFDRSKQGDGIVYPGADGTTSITVDNKVPYGIAYTVVLYEDNEADIPVNAGFSGGNLYTTADYGLPKGVKESQVIRAAKGWIEPRSSETFYVDWHWLFEVSDAQNVVDTAFGTKVPLDEMTLGLYVVVEDQGSYDADQPKTGDEFPVGLYAAGAALCFLLLMFLLWRRDEGEDDAEPEEA